LGTFLNYGCKKFYDIGHGVNFTNILLAFLAQRFSFIQCIFPNN
jgi:hypothetical protein